MAERTSEDVYEYASAVIVASVDLLENHGMADDLHRGMAKLISELSKDLKARTTEYEYNIMRTKANGSEDLVKNQWLTERLVTDVFPSVRQDDTVKHRIVKRRKAGKVEEIV